MNFFLLFPSFSFSSFAGTQRRGLSKGEESLWPSGVGQLHALSD